MQAKDFIGFHCNKLSCVDAVDTLCGGKGAGFKAAGVLAKSERVVIARCRGLCPGGSCGGGSGCAADDGAAAGAPRPNLAPGAQVQGGDRGDCAREGAPSGLQSTYPT